MITIKIDQHQFDNVRKSLNNLGDKIVNPDAKAMRRFGDAVVEDIDRRFATRGYDTWAENKPSTIARKGHGEVLVDSNVMRSSVKMQISEGSVNVSVPEGGRNHDPRVPLYAQKGKGRMQRKIIEVTPQLEQRLANAAALWVRDMIRAFRQTV